jgi:hypothetical protein
MSRLFIALLGVGVLSQVSLADDPPPASEAKPPAAAPAAPTLAANETPLDVAFDRYVKKHKIREKDGQKLYCRNAAPLGTRMTRTVCLSENQLREEVIAQEAARDALRKPGVTPCSDGNVAC